MISYLNNGNKEDDQIDIGDINTTEDIKRTLVNMQNTLSTVNKQLLPETIEEDNDYYNEKITYQNESIKNNITKLMEGYKYILGLLQQLFEFNILKNNEEEKKNIRVDFLSKYSLDAIIDTDGDGLSQLETNDGDYGSIQAIYKLLKENNFDKITKIYDAIYYDNSDNTTIPLKELIVQYKRSIDTIINNFNAKQTEYNKTLEEINKNLANIGSPDLSGVATEATLAEVQATVNNIQSLNTEKVTESINNLKSYFQQTFFPV